MQLDRQFVIDELKKQGQSQQVQKALDELPAKVDHEQHAALLEKFGIDPGKLAESSPGARRSSRTEPANHSERSARPVRSGAGAVSGQP